MASPVENPDFWLGWLYKIGSVILTFIAGIVSATWVISAKVRGWEDRLKSVEKTQNECPVKHIKNIDEKLDRLHERIDQVLLAGKEQGRGKNENTKG